MSKLPLSRFKVVDLTRVRAGPTAVRQLADWGADVVKVEAPEGDGGLGGARHGPDFQNLHRNKRSITLDLKKPEGGEVLRRLVREADVVVENYRPDVKHRLGVDYESLKAVNPRIVYASISGFGQTGPYRDRPSFDFIAQAMSGFMSTTGEPEGAPMRAGPPIADLVAGLQGALGVCAALVRRGRTGQGETVGASLNNAMISVLGFLAANYLATGEAPARSGNDHAIVSPYGMFRTGDGEIAIAPSQEQSYQRLIDALGAPELRDDPNFRSNDLRVANRAAINAAIEQRLKGGTSDYWIARLNAAGVPCDRVKTLPEVFADPQVIEQQMVLDIEHPGHGKVRMLGFPIKFAQAPCRLHRPAPDLGADSEEVLAELGYSPEDIARLRTAGVV